MIDGVSVSVVVCSYGRSWMLADVVASILNADDPPDQFIIIHQTTSPDAKLQAIAGANPCVQYMPSTISTLSGKRNLGISLAQGDILIFTDDDVTIPAAWIGSLVREQIRVGKRSVVTGRVLAGAGEFPGSFAPSLHTESRPRTYTRRSTLTDPLATFNFAAYRELLLKIGDFDERLGPGTEYPSCEDNDYGLRILESGHQIEYAPDALVYHRSWRPKTALNDLRFRYGLGQGGFYGKHLLGGDWFIWAKMFAAIGRHSRRIITTDVKESISQLYWLRGLVVGTMRWSLQYGRQAPRRSTRFRSNRSRRT